MKTTLVLGFATVLSVFFAAIAEGVLVLGKKPNAIQEKNGFALKLSFFTIWFFIAFSNIGVDYNNYIKTIELVHDFSNLFTYSSVEPGLGLWFTIAWRIMPNPHWVLFTIKTIPILIYYHYSCKYREKVNLIYVVLAYCAILYVQSFYLLSIQLAAAFEVMAVFYFLEKKPFRTIICFVIGVSLHYSAVILVIPFLSFVYVTTSTKLRTYSKLRVAFLITAYCGVIAFSTLLINYLVSSVSILQKYAMYTGSSAKGFSLYQTFLYIPAIYAIVVILKNRCTNRVDIFALMSILAGFVVGQMALVYPILDRMYFYFALNFIFFIPFYLYKMKTREITKPVISYRSTKMLLILYYGIRIYLNYRDYLGMFNPSQMYEYRFFFPTLW